MGYQDRYYYRENKNDRTSPLMWLLSGSVNLFTFSGIRVRAHASLLLFIGLDLLLNAQAGYNLSDRVTAMSILFALVLLHEFGHCFTARGVGGSADEIMMWPLGGLAMATPPNRPLPSFLTSAAGPAVNFAICGISAGLLAAIYHYAPPLNPTGNLLAPGMFSWHQLGFYLWYIYVVSFALMLFNLLPIYPLDGGQMLHALLWPFLGYGKALLVSCNVGIVGSVLLGGWALTHGPQWLVLAIAISCLMFCIQKRAMVRSAGTWSFDDNDLQIPHRTHRRHHLSRYAKWKARRQIRQEETEQERIDAILQKVHDKGMHALSWTEKRALRKATDRQRQREMEESRRN